MSANFNIIGTSDYRKNFWNAMRQEPYNCMVLDHAEGKTASAYMLPAEDASSMDDFIKQESISRNLCTTVKFYGGASRIFAHDCADFADWVPEGSVIPLYDGLNDFTRYPVDSHNLAVFVKLTEEFVHDAAFDMEEHLSRRFAKNFAKAEDDAFLNGDGANKPTGLLHAEKGAEVGATSKKLSFDDLIKLYASVKPEYRSKGTWLMNDDTALFLRTMKDDSGAYLWNSDKDTILGKPVVIGDGMPNTESGKCPVLFGDFNYYWMIHRSPVRVRSLKEKFALHGQVGYLAMKFVDGRLMRREAVKALKITA